MTAFLVIILIIGNLLLITGSVFGDLADNGIAWLIVIAAIAMDFYFIYKIIQSVSENNEKKRVAEATRIVNEIISRYSPSKVPSVQEARTFDVDSSFLNKEVVLCVKECKDSIFTLLQQSSKVNKKLMVILSCNGSTTEIEKYAYLSSNLTEIESLKNESDKLCESISKNKIELLNENSDLLIFLKTTFASLLQSKKCSSNNVNGGDFLCEKTPNDLSLFQFKYAPSVLLVNDFFFCLFTNVVLVFDKNGIFSTAIDPTAISVALDKLTEHVLISNGSVVRQEFTDVDSKLIQQGITRTTWTYTRNDGLPDRRYSYNPRIEYRSNDYEYGIIRLSIINITISFKVSSKTAITRFGSFIEKYIRKCNDLHNPISDFLLLLKYLSDDDHSSINNILETTNSSTLNKNYFCCQTNN